MSCRFYKIIFMFFITLNLFFLSAMVNAETIVKSRITALNRLLPLQKMTVGPQDQYQGVVSPSESILVFTHKAELAPHLIVQDLTTGSVFNLLPLTADSQEPTFNKEGDLAFTYYKHNSRGDICYLRSLSQVKSTVTENSVHCLKRLEQNNTTERVNPFWINGTEIGFIEHELHSLNRKIISENLQSGAQKVLYEGRVWSPQMNAEGRYLTFNEIFSNDRAPYRRIVVYDLLTHELHKLTFELPGISAFPIFSLDEKHLYFSQYLNDTNSDNTIDGSDHAVLFRMPIAKIDTPDFFPEQLTPVERNCNFPKPSKNSIFLTCDFEGSLDIYRIPLTGVVPADWKMDLLQNAFHTSRSYQERVLILNSIKYRFGTDRKNYDEEMFINLLLSEDTSAARYYLDKMKTSSEYQYLPDFYELMKIHLVSLAVKKKLENQAELSQSLRAEIKYLETRFKTLQTYPRLNQLLLAELELLKNNSNTAWNSISKIQFTQKSFLLERYLYFEIAREAAHRKKPQTSQDIIHVYSQTLHAPELSEDSQIYYGVSFLSELETLYKDPQARLDFILAFNDKTLSNSISTLLSAESIGLKLILAKDQPQKEVIYKDLDKIMSETRNNYDLRKAIYVRTILNFNKAHEFLFVNLIATNWLRYTEHNDTEFIYAREVFSDSSLEQAYSHLSKQALVFADNYFYQSLSLTDDLESHYGFITTMVKENKRAVLTDRYRVLRDRKFIEDNMKFVEALWGLIDHSSLASGSLRFSNPADSKNQPPSIATYKEAIEKLEAMSVDRDSPMRYLLLGFCELQEFLQTAKGYNFDNELLKQAHHDLMLAYDLGRDNDRIKAAALMNLGILQLRAANPGLSTQFFALRKRLGFISDLQKVNFTWIYARSLFLSNQSEVAAQEIAQLDSKLISTPLLEREAFYWMASQNYQEALPLLTSLVQGGKVQGPLNLSRLYLNYGLALFKNGKNKEAREALLKSLHWVAQTPAVKADADHFIDYRPERLELMVHGLLGQMGSLEERIKALENRSRLLKGTQSLFEEGLELDLKNDLQLAYLNKESQPKQSRTYLNQAMHKAFELGKSSSYVSNPVLQALIASLSFYLQHPELYDSSPMKEFNALYKAFQESIDKQKLISPFIKYQQLKIKILESAFQHRALQKTPPSKQELELWKSTELSEIVKKSLPEKWLELSELQAQLLK